MPLVGFETPAPAHAKASHDVTSLSFNTRFPVRPYDGACKSNTVEDEIAQAQYINADINVTH